MEKAPSSSQYPDKTILKSEAYSILPDRVVQGRYEARALSPTRISSNYESPADRHKSPLLYFKFSLNGFDNEMEWGKNHQLICFAPDGLCESPVITFGQQFIHTVSIPTDSFLLPRSSLRLRLDLREVLASFRQSGYFTTFNGDKIYRRDFKGVFVAGSILPLSWNFDRLAFQKDMQLHDANGDGIYEINLQLNPPIRQEGATRQWKLTTNISEYPVYKPEQVLLEALYNLSLEEMVKDVEPDNTFRTGLEWDGVWTRDVSYSTLLSMAILRPDIARNSLLQKVKNERIIQDTGTGGAYPVSTDRVIWAVAAWEIYLVTGDADWLHTAYPIIKNSVNDDAQNAYDPETGLVRGESSFLDWREQTYPDWMQPADIYDSFCLGTNAVHYQTNVVLARMAEILQDKSATEKYQRQAEKIKKSINEYFWQPDKNYYGQYLYGRIFKTLSPRAEALGAALCVLFDIADPEKQRQLVQNMPLNDFGIPCIYPQVPDIPAYHNNAVWPFVQAFWSLAAAKSGNEKALLQSLSAIYRPAALFLTNKENFTATDGDFSGTQINSDQMLWSLAGHLAQVYKILFGLHYEPEKLVFKPFVPRALGKYHNLTNFRYRQAQLDIYITGFGNQVNSFHLNNQLLDYPEIPATLTGKNIIRITLTGNTPEAEEKINMAPPAFSPATPQVVLANKVLSWSEIPEAQYYKIIHNGEEAGITRQPRVSISPAAFGEYQVIAVNAQHLTSFASEPVWVGPEQVIYKPTSFQEESEIISIGYTGSGFVEISREKNIEVSFNIFVPGPGLYALDFRYANGSGPISTQNKCAFRTLRRGDAFIGTAVFPQRGDHQWSNWGFSNVITARLPAGEHVVTLRLEPPNENMHGEVNLALLDYLRLTQIKD